jgi:hypothetical protein
MTNGFNIGETVYWTTLVKGVMSQHELEVERIDGDMISVFHTNMIGQRIESTYPSNELSKIKPRSNDMVSMSNHPFPQPTIPANQMPIGPL